MAKRKSPGGEEQGGTAAPAAAAAEVRPYLVLARKYRPQTFDDLIGQEAMVRTLRNAFATNRIAQAYMLTGVRGVGKTTTARILARALNYAIPGKVDIPTIDMPSLGEHCQAIMESRHPDVVEMDAASNTGVDSVREITESARYRPIVARTKVFIIDEVHMLSKPAFNALLKTLEEPPPHVKFIFATTEIRKVPVTVLSRCQRFDLRRVDVPKLATHFRNIAGREGFAIEDDALLLIARAAEGSVRDGLSILDQAFATSGGKVEAAVVRQMLGLSDRGRILVMLGAVLSGDAGKALSDFAGLYRDGADPVQVLTDLAETVHAATRIKAAGIEAATEGLSADERRGAAALADRLSLGLLSRAWQMLLKGIEEAGEAPDPFAATDMVLIRMAHMASLPAPEDLMRRLKEGGAVQPPATAGATAAPPALPASAPPRQQAPARAPSAASPANGGPARAQLAVVETQPSPLPVADVAPPAPAPPRFDSYADLVAFVGERRDARLRIALEDHVRLVRFEPPRLEIALAPEASPSLVGEIGQKLGKWTGTRWIVVVSREAGERPLGEVRREQEAAEREAARAHPLLRTVLGAFPEAEITAVRSIAPPQDAAGSETLADSAPSSDDDNGTESEAES